MTEISSQVLLRNKRYNANMTNCFMPPFSVEQVNQKMKTHKLQVFSSNFLNVEYLIDEPNISSN